MEIFLILLVASICLLAGTKTLTVPAQIRQRRLRDAGLDRHH